MNRKLVLNFVFFIISLECWIHSSEYTQAALSCIHFRVFSSIIQNTKFSTLFTIHYIQIYSMDDCCWLKLVDEETAGIKLTVPDKSSGMKQTVKLIRGCTYSKSAEVLVNWVILSTTSRLHSGSGALTQTLLIKPNIIYVMANKKICL